MQKFKCDCCGLCCRHIDRSPLSKDLDSGDGVCKFLDTEKNLCKIYKNRPDFCNVEVGYKKYFSKLYTEEEYLNLNYESCRKLKLEHQKEKVSAPYLYQAAQTPSTETIQGPTACKG